MTKKAPQGTATQIADERQSQLKLLIARGKEQGYLTYVEVNDHLPSEIVDPEQIEDIVNMINDMGIPVYEKAPDAESLLLTDATTAPDEEAVEEATAALANLDAEFGRTTDPVRMYMREMGTVELLTREGEIRIAKRIEEGLEAVKIALGSYPGTYDLLLRSHESVKAGQMRLVDVIVGFVDPNAPDEIAQPQNPKMMALEAEEAGDDDEADGDEDEEAIDTGPDPEEAAKRFAAIAKAHHQYVNALDKVGSKDPKTLKLRKKICGELMELKLSPKMFDQLIDNLRQHVTEVRLLEREIMFLCIKQAGMPRKDFISTFPKNETSTRWLDKHIKAKKRYSAPLARFKEEIERRQNKLKDLESAYHLLINEIKEINREVSIGEAKARRA
ncbi:MAG: RNA polymerase sigma factor RpoD, partial [Gammaproteobacteria bacterium]|nr:RNA polymerase sigma factor RpoD [Gammaproteobacteria bacterium]